MATKESINIEKGLQNNKYFKNVGYKYASIMISGIKFVFIATIFYALFDKNFDRLSRAGKFTEELLKSFFACAKSSL